MDCSMPGFPVLHYILVFRFISIDSLVVSNHLILCSTLFSFCLQSFPASFPVSRLLASGGQSVAASASVFPVNIQGWCPLGLTDLILLSKGLSRVFSSSTLESINSLVLCFLLVQLSHLPMTTGKSFHGSQPCHGERACLHNSIKLWTVPWRATQDKWDIVESSDETWSTGGGNDKPLQYSCYENPMNRFKWHHWGYIFSCGEDTYTWDWGKCEKRRIRGKNLRLYVFCILISSRVVKAASSCFFALSLRLVKTLILQCLFQMSLL